MSNEFIEMRFENMERELRQIEKEVVDIEQLTEKSIRAVDKCLFAYNEYVKNQSFRKKEDELFYFKFIRPRILARMIYYKEMLNWWKERPECVEGSEQKAYWKDKMTMIRDYFQESNTLCRNLLADFIYPDRSASNDKPDFTKDNGLVIAKLLAYGALYQFCKRQTRLIRRSSRFRGNKEGKRQKRKGR